MPVLLSIVDVGNPLPMKNGADVDLPGWGLTAWSADDVQSGSCLLE